MTNPSTIESTQVGRAGPCAPPSAAIHVTGNLTRATLGIARADVAAIRSRCVLLRETIADSYVRLRDASPMPGSSAESAIETCLATFSKCSAHFDKASADLALLESTLNEFI